MSEVEIYEPPNVRHGEMDESPSVIGLETEDSLIEESENLQRSVSSSKKAKNKSKQVLQEEKKLRDEEERKRMQRLVDDKLQVEDFISEVEKYPCLWNSGEEGYSNKQEKVKMWITVICTFIENFNEMKNAEKDEIGK